MTATPQPAPAPTLTQPPTLLRDLLRSLIVRNPLFLLSAALMLLGVHVLNEADGDRRGLGLAVRLLGTIQLYEGALLGAALLLARRAAGSAARDVRILCFLLAAFQADATYTWANVEGGLRRAHGDGAVALAAACGIALAAAKLWGAARALGARIGALEWAALLAGPAAMLADTPLAEWLKVDRPLPWVPWDGYLAVVLRQSTGHGLGLLAAAALLMPALVIARRPDGLARRFAPLTALLALAHAFATAQRHDAVLPSFLAPALLALAVAGPILLSLASGYRTAWRVALTSLALLAALADEGALESAELVAVAATQAALLAQGGSYAMALALVPSLSLAVPLGEAGWAGWAGWGTDFERLLSVPSTTAYGVAAFYLGLRLRVWRGLAFAPLAWAVLAASVNVSGKPPLPHGLALDLAALGLLAWTHRTHGSSVLGSRWRKLGAAALALTPVLAVVFGGKVPPAADAWAAAAKAALGLALFAASRDREYLILPAVIGAGVGGPALRSEKVSWGSVLVGLSFAAVALGTAVGLARERLLRRLDGGREEA